MLKLRLQTVYLLFSEKILTIMQYRDGCNIHRTPLVLAKCFGSTIHLLFEFGQNIIRAALTIYFQISGTQTKILTKIYIVLLVMLLKLFYKIYKLVSYQHNCCSLYSYFIIIWMSRIIMLHTEQNLNIDIFFKYKFKMR